MPVRLTETAINKAIREVSHGSRRDLADAGCPGLTNREVTQSAGRREQQRRAFDWSQLVIIGRSGQHSIDWRALCGVFYVLAHEVICYGFQGLHRGAAAPGGVREAAPRNVPVGGLDGSPRRSTRIVRVRTPTPATHEFRTCGSAIPVCLHCSTLPQRCLAPTKEYDFVLT